MGHAPRRLLPLFSDLMARKPAMGDELRLEHARRRLGGTAMPGFEAGRVVMVRGAGRRSTPGVVLHETKHDVDVWVSPTVVRRVAHDAVENLDANDARIDDTLLAASIDARVFGSVRTGARVVVREADGTRAEAMVIERCRYGAIVAYDDGRIKAVGFRALWASEHQM